MSCKYICDEYEVTFRLSRLKIARLDSPMYGTSFPFRDRLDELS